MGGGRGYPASDSLGLLEIVLSSSVVLSLLSSDFGGVGGNRREVSGNSVPDFWVSASVYGGGL